MPCAASQPELPAVRQAALRGWALTTRTVCPAIACNATHSPALHEAADKRLGHIPHRAVGLLAVALAYFLVYGDHRSAICSAQSYYY